MSQMTNGDPDCITGADIEREVYLCSGCLPVSSAEEFLAFIPEMLKMSGMEASTTSVSLRSVDGEARFIFTNQVAQE